MWGKQNEGQMIQNQPGQAPAQQPSQQTPASNYRAPAPATGSTVLGKSVRIIGEVSSDDELYLDGDLEGKLNLRNRLTIGPNSKVNANIRAQEVVVFGTVKGNVESESRVSLRTGASIVGDIKTAGIVIEDGAYFKGGIDISRGGEGMKTAPASATPKAHTASAGQKQ
jgi:cytoskeletal protein CcmA (bactofilin family)